VSQETRKRTLAAAGLVHPRPEAVTASLFVGAEPFFFPLDKLQVKYEMLRSQVVDGCSVTAAAAAHGYTRAGFYLIAGAFEERGMAGLVDDRPGRRGPFKLNEEIVGFLRDAEPELSGAALARRVEERFGVSLHRRTVDRARRR
jgi:transposase